MSDLTDRLDRYHRSLEAFIEGDPEPQKVLYSRRDDATLANPLGPPAEGLGSRAPCVGQRSLAVP